MKVLIVNQSSTERRFITRLFSAYCYNQFSIVHAAHGYEALQIIEYYDFDLIIMDLNLPYISGNELIHQLKENQQTAAIPIIVITALYTFAINDRYLLEKTHAILSKPFKPADFARKIDSIFTRQLSSATKGLYL